MGAHAAQLLANQDTGLQYQLVMANVGKDLDLWQPAVDHLGGITGGESPLVGVIGFPNSTEATLQATEALSEKKIPTIGSTLTSPDMKADYLFKTSPSNEHLAEALSEYLKNVPESAERLHGVGLPEMGQLRRRICGACSSGTSRRSTGCGSGARRSWARSETTTKAFPGASPKSRRRSACPGADTVFYTGRDRRPPVPGGATRRRVVVRPQEADADPQGRHRHRPRS